MPTWHTHQPKERHVLIALIAVIVLSLHLGLGWWTVAPALAIAFLPTSSSR